MDRRKFLKTTALTGLVSASAVNSGQAKESDVIKWKMVTTWPKNFPALGTGAENLAKLIDQMSGGRIKIKVYAAGELVPTFEAFDAVSRGTAEICHGVSAYWKGKIPAAQFFTGVPFGLTGQEMNAWLYNEGGVDLWRELYEPFGVIPAPAGNSGVQMAGWFNKPIDSLNDLKKMKMRIAGLGGEVLNRIGGTTVMIPGGEIFSALKNGTIDATEWIGPYNDLAFGFYKAAKYYYYPGWQEPGSSLECLINAKAFKKLPKDLQTIVMNACKASNADLFAEFTARNASALETLKTEHKVKVRKIPDDVLDALAKASNDMLLDMISKDQMAKKIFDSVTKFQKQAAAWHEISEKAYFNARAL